MFLRDCGGCQSGLGVPARPLRLRQAEIEDLCLTALRDEDVRRLDVAMNDLLLMRGVERIGSLNRQLEQVGHRERFTRNPVLQLGQMGRLGVKLKSDST